MFLDDVKRQAALDSTYARGLGLAVSDCVKGLDVDYGPDGLVFLSSAVRGSGGGWYEVDVALDGGRETVSAHSCSCPAHEKYSGMCKHAVATALVYLDSIGEISLSASGSGKASGGRGAKKALAVKRRVYTSRAIEQFIALSAENAQAAARVAVDAPSARPADPADLVCVLSKGAESHGYYYGDDDDMWSLGFKIVRGRASYVVKSVSELVDAWQSGRAVTYGKNLSFVHGRSSFTDRANELLDLIAPLVALSPAARENRYFSHASSRSLKAVPLTGVQVAEVLEIMMGGSIVYDNWDYGYYGGYSKKKATLPVVDADPLLRASIVRDEFGDYELSVHPKGMECVMGADRLFVIGEDSVMRCSDAFSRKAGAFCRAVLPCEEALHICDRDMPAFCSAALLLLRECTELSAPPDLEKLVPPQPEFVFKISQLEDYLVCAVQVKYGDTSISLFDPVLKGQVARDAAREAAVQQVVRTYFREGDYELPDYANPRENHYGFGFRQTGGHYGRASQAPCVPCFPKHDDEAYYLLFSDGLRELAQLGEVLLSERLRNVTVRQPPSVGVEANVDNGLLDISIESPGMTPEELISYLASYERRQRFVRLKNGDIARLDGSVQALGDLANGLGLSAVDLAGGARGIPANRTLFVDAMLKRAAGLRFERNEGFRRIVRDFETVSDADIDAPVSLAPVLRPYQAEGFRWLSVLGKAGFGGILADDMGLGKTLQAIAYILARREAGERKPALVVCPASLMYNWTAELGKFAPQLRAAPVSGAKQSRMRLIAGADEYDVLVTSYDLMKRDIEAYEAQGFSCAVLDEAQYIKNSSTKSAQCARRIPSDVRFALTGTPIENRLSELWSIFEFLMPGVLGSKDSFNRRFSSPIASGDQAAAQCLQKLVGPFILRRLKGDVLTDLPEKNESVVLASMGGEQENLYRANEAKLALTLSSQPPEEFAGSKLQVLAELTKLRQLCCDPRLFYENYSGGSAKLETCMDLVCSAVDGGHQLLLFSQFTSMLELIEERLGAEGIDYLKLTGATTKEERARLVKRFQSGEAPVFLISLKAGGVGLNLTAADIVIHYDPWWNLAAQDQATDRAHRIGQEREVSVFKLIAKGTIEERILKMQERKRGIAESVLGGEAASSSAITREDILVLLDAKGD